MDDGDRGQRELGLRFALILLCKCDELWAFGAPSEGMGREIAKAKRRGLPIRYFNNKGEEVSNENSLRRQPPFQAVDQQENYL
jgi:hypothetical protein